VFTGAHHWLLSWAKWIQPTPSQTISLRGILILSSHLHQGLLTGFFPSWFLINILYAYLISPMRSTCPAHTTVIHLITLITFGERTSYVLLIMQTSSASRHLFPSRHSIYRIIALFSVQREFKALMESNLSHHAYFCLQFFFCPLWKWQLTFEKDDPGHHWNGGPAYCHHVTQYGGIRETRWSQRIIKIS
jgi:lysylphosphatidylglycerol synthetase-like protein (DUF2156 family)